MPKDIKQRTALLALKRTLRDVGITGRLMGRRLRPELCLAIENTPYRIEIDTTVGLFHVWDIRHEKVNGPLPVGAHRIWISVYSWDLLVFGLKRLLRGDAARVVREG